MIKLFSLSFAVLSSLLTLFGQNQENLPLIHADSGLLHFAVPSLSNVIDWQVDLNLPVNTFNSMDDKLRVYSELDTLNITLKSIGDKVQFAVLLANNDRKKVEVIRVMSYLETLKLSGTYVKMTPKKPFKFYYQDKQSPDLLALRNKYKLDSIAGTGNDVSQVIRLMNWVHKSIEHDGAAEQIPEKNADALLHYFKKEKKGLNCRMLAITLNDCYLAMGFKSRVVTCIPKDIDFTDCHVINSVFVPSLNKWIWMDPTSDAYVMNEKNELLSIQEVRYNLINNIKMHINEDANWNFKYKETTQEYLFLFMANNLYRFSCNQFSQYNYETWTEKIDLVSIELLPNDVYYPKKYRKGYKKNSKDIHEEFYTTTDDNLFWSSPE